MGVSGGASRFSGSSSKFGLFSISAQPTSASVGVEVVAGVYTFADVSITGTTSRKVTSSTFSDSGAGAPWHRPDVRFPE
jgi:hypothetical protein